MAQVQTIERHDLQLDSGDSTGTDYDWVAAPSATGQLLVEMIVIQNNDTVSQVVTLKLKTYSGSYVTILTKDYTITAGESELPVEFMNAVLEGDASNPDKISIAFDTSLTASDTIDCIASAVKFT